MFPQKDDPFIPFAEMLINPSQVIENQEARGQQMLVRSEVLPRKCQFCTREQLEQMGVIFGENADDLFVYVKLPEGWSKQKASHNMWSKLIDEKGRNRASIYYKAAFYDRDAFIFLNCRYSYFVEPTCGRGNNNYRDFEWYSVVKDQEEIIWHSETIGKQPDFKDHKIFSKWLDKKNVLAEIAQGWLCEHYPEWENPLAYWDK